MAIKDTIRTTAKGIFRKSEEKVREEVDETALLEQEDKYFNESKNYRSTTIERQWFINHAYYKGWHNVKYSKDSGKLVWGSKDPLDFAVNQIYATCRAIRGAVTRTAPKWDVDALPYSTLDSNTSSALGEYLSFVYDKLHLRHMVKEIVLYGLLYGQGIFQYGYDAEADKGEGLPWVQVLDPFDTYIDPYARGIEDARYVIKVVARPRELIEANENYDQEVVKDLATSGKQSESSYKELINSNVADQSSLSSNLLLHEAWIVEKEGIRVMTVCEGKILRNEITDFQKLPFEIYFPDINMNEMYGEGWVKNLVPLNKALNYLEKSILEYNIIFSKGKYVTDSNSGIKIVNNRHGQIIRHKPGHTFAQMDMKPMSNTPFNQIQNIQSYIQNIGAAHEAFMGKAPQGVTAGAAFETLVANAYTNIIDLIDNLADCLARLGEDILKIGYQHQLITKPFRTSGGDMMGVISGKVEEKDRAQADYDVAVLPENPEVKVSITSGLAHTKEGKRDLLTMLRGGGDISRRTLLENYDIDSEEEANRIIEEKLEEMQLMKVIQQETQPPAPEGENLGGMEETEGPTGELPGGALGAPMGAAPGEIPGSEV